MKLEYVSPVFKQQLSHQLIKGRFTKLKLYGKPELPVRCVMGSKKGIEEICFPNVY